MIENYINNLELLVLNVYSGGVQVPADSTPTVSAMDAQTGEAVAMTSVQTINPSGESFNYYTTTLDPTEVSYVREIVVTWNYTLNGIDLISVENVVVVQPLITPSEIYEAYPQFKSTGADPKTLNEIKSMEKIVRRVIHTYTNQEFEDRGSKAFRLYGNNDDFLQLPDRIYELEYVARDDPRVIYYDTTVSGGKLFVRDDNGAETSELSNMKGPIEVVTWDDDDDVMHTIRRRFNWLGDWNKHFPKEHVSSDFLWNEIFDARTVYLIRAKAGWKSVPANVALAAQLLIGDYFCPDVAYHEKGIGSVSSADYSFKYTEDPYSTTGNIVADQLLSNYINWNVVAV